MIAPLAAVLGLLVARRAPAHRPMARGLAAWAAIGLASQGIAHWTAAGAIPPEVGNRARLILGFGLCAVGAWAVGRSYHFAARWWAYAGAWALASVAGCAAPVGPWWDRSTPAAMAAACLVEVAAWGAWRVRAQTDGITQRVAGVVAGCDVAGLLLALLLGAERVAGWASISASAVVVVQVLWLRRARARA